MDYLAEIREFHRTDIEPYLGKPTGCTEQEVQTLEERIGFPLPLAYKQFLLWMGKDYFGVFQGSDWFINYVERNTRFLGGLLAENEVDFKLPEHYLAFFGHQGYTYAWFALPKIDENPPVWFFHEGMLVEPEMFDFPVDGKPVQRGTFTDFVLEDMSGNASFLPTTAKYNLATRQAFETGKPVTVDRVTFVFAGQPSQIPTSPSSKPKQAPLRQDFLATLGRFFGFLRTLLRRLG